MKKRCILIAPDSLKGCCTSLQAAQAMAQGAREAGDFEILQFPLADGGEGTMQVLTQALNGRFVQMRAHDPLQRELECEYGILQDQRTAVLDVAQTCGLTLLQKEELNPMKTSTFGVGEQIVHAFQQGCRRFLIGLGGSATCDGGKGMIAALAPQLEALQSCEFIVLCDVNNPLYGPNGAAFVFAPQKGAKMREVVLLDHQLRQLSQQHNAKLAFAPGAGAAGGLGYAFLTFLKAHLQSGIETILHELNFDHYLPQADIILTAEGCTDRQTLSGKLPFGLLQKAKTYHIPTFVLAGKVKDTDLLAEAGFAQVVGINPPQTDLKTCLNTDFALERLKITSQQVIQSWLAKL